MKRVRGPDGQPIDISDEEYVSAVAAGTIRPVGDPTVNVLPDDPTAPVISMPVSLYLSDDRYKDRPIVDQEVATDVSRVRQAGDTGHQAIAALSALGMGLGGALAGAADPAAAKDIELARQVNPGAVALGTIADTLLTAGVGAGLSGISGAASAASAARAGAGASTAARALQYLRAPELAATRYLESRIGSVAANAAMEAAANGVVGSLQHAIDQEIAGKPVTVEGLLGAGATAALLGGALSLATRPVLSLAGRAATAKSEDYFVQRVLRPLGPSRKEMSEALRRMQSNPLLKEAVLREATEEIPAIAGSRILDPLDFSRAVQARKQTVADELQSLAAALDNTGETVSISRLRERIAGVARDMSSSPGTAGRALEAEKFADEVAAAAAKLHERGVLKTPGAVPFSVLSSWRSDLGKMKASALRAGDDLSPAVRIYSIVSDELESSIQRALPMLEGTEAAKKLVDAYGVELKDLWAARNAKWQALSMLEDMAERGAGREANRSQSLGDRLAAVAGSGVGATVGSALFAPVGGVLGAGAGWFATKALSSMQRKFGDQTSAAFFKAVGSQVDSNGKRLPIAEAVKRTVGDTVSSLLGGAATAPGWAPAIAGAVGGGASALSRLTTARAVSSYVLPPAQVTTAAAQLVAAGMVPPSGVRSSLPTLDQRLASGAVAHARLLLQYAPRDWSRASRSEAARAQAASDMIVGGPAALRRAIDEGKLTPLHWEVFSRAYPALASRLREAVESGEAKLPTPARRVIAIKPADPVVHAAIRSGVGTVRVPHAAVRAGSSADEVRTRTERLEA